MWVQLSLLINCPVAFARWFRLIVCTQLSDRLSGEQRPRSASWVGENYRQTSNISRNLVGNKFADNSDVVGAAACPNYIFILDLTPGFSALDKDNCKTRRETFKFWDLVCLILEIWGCTTNHMKRTLLLQRRIYAPLNKNAVRILPHELL